MLGLETATRLDKYAKVILVIIMASVGTGIALGIVIAPKLQGMFGIPSSTPALPAYCDIEEPTLECVSAFPASYYGRNLTLTGNFKAYYYDPSAGLWHDDWGKYTFENPAQARTLYLDVWMEGVNGTVLSSTLSTAGEIHPVIINHLQSLKQGDKMQITGRVDYDTKPGCTSSSARINDCPVVGELWMQSIDGISIDPVFPWELPPEDISFWFLGEGLRNGLQVNYELNYTDFTYNSQGGATIPKSYKITMDFMESKWPGEWNVDIVLNDNPDQPARSFECLSNTKVGALDCSKSDMPAELKELLDVTIFFHGQTANAEHPQPLNPIMSRWPTLERVDVWAGYTFPAVFYDENVSIGNEQINTTVVGWVRLMHEPEIGSKWWIKDEFPFPIKAYAHFNKGYGNYRLYQLELSNMGIPSEVISGEDGSVVLLRP